jgi:hypothetical protein
MKLFLVVITDEGEVLISDVMVPLAKIRSRFLVS